MLIALQFEIDNFIDYTNGEALLFQPVFIIQFSLSMGKIKIIYIKFLSEFMICRSDDSLRRPLVNENKC